VTIAAAGKALAPIRFSFHRRSVNIGRDGRTPLTYAPKSTPRPIANRAEAGGITLQEAGARPSSSSYWARAVSIYGQATTTLAGPAQHRSSTSTTSIDGIATPMSYYAIMAVGCTIVFITSGIDISSVDDGAGGARSAAVLQQFARNAPHVAGAAVAFGVPHGDRLLAGSSTARSSWLRDAPVHRHARDASHLPRHRQRPRRIKTLPGPGKRCRRVHHGFMRLRSADSSSCR
jgi:hypothetical protein